MANTDQGLYVSQPNALNLLPRQQINQNLVFLFVQLDLVKFIASHKPLVASTKISERIITLIKDLLASPVPLQVLLERIAFVFLSFFNRMQFLITVIFRNLYVRVENVHSRM